MVHLAIAVQMRELNDKRLTPSFLLESIAPDAAWKTTTGN
jgi:hypothetical protein